MIRQRQRKRFQLRASRASQPLEQLPQRHTQLGREAVQRGHRGIALSRLNL